MDIMEFERFGTEDDNNEDDDAAVQYMIEQSLLESTKQRATPRDATTPDTRRSIFLSDVCLGETINSNIINVLLIPVPSSITDLSFTKQVQF